MLNFQGKCSLFVLILLCAGGWGTTVIAQDKVPSRLMVEANVRYEAIISDIVNQRDNIDYGLLRSYYISSRYYEPIGDRIKDKLIGYAYEVQTSEDKEQVAAILKDYNALLYAHLANISIVNLGVSLAQQDKRFGAPWFFKKVRDELFKDVLYSGTGRTLNDAYDVINLAEETMLLSHARAKNAETIAEKEGIVYYNMHDYNDPESGQKTTMFVNVTIPMQYLEEVRTNEQKAVDLKFR